MSDAVRFTAVVDTAIGEEFLGMCYGEGMIGCEEKEIGNTTEYVCYFEDDATCKLVADMVRDMTISTGDNELIEDRDWNAKWRETIEPVKVTDTIWCSPEWLTPPLAEGEHWIKIEPRMAFGTGHHETTRLCSQLIARDRGNRTSLLDIGTGSGILCFVAEFHGYERMTGVELDQDCEINLEENLAANRKDAHIDFLIGTTDDLDKEETFDTVVMNMIRSESAPLLNECRNRLTENGLLIWSGLLTTERELCISLAKEAGFTMVDELAEGEWWSAHFVA